MDDSVFDAMLRTALSEALEEDYQEMAQKEGPHRRKDRPSRHQAKRMRRMLADPFGYERRSRITPEKEKRPAPEVRPFRWRHCLQGATAAALILLLTGTAAAYALRGGDFFRHMFESSPWATEYSGIADIDQVQEMDGGACKLGTVVEDEHFRFELLDAVSEGENALAAVKITVLDMQPVEEALGGDTVAPAAFLNTSGSFFDSGSSETSFIYPNEDNDLEDNQLLLIFRSSKNSAGLARSCDIVFEDFGYQKWSGDRDTIAEDVVLIPGKWTIPITLKFDGGTVLEGQKTVQLEDCTFTIDRICISALSVSIDLHCPREFEDRLYELLPAVEICMRDGGTALYTGFSSGGGGEQEDGEVNIHALYEFELPLNKAQFFSFRIGGKEIPLTK